MATSASDHGVIGDPIFILCAARSGSTLLRYLIDTHPAVCCPAELRLGPMCDLVTTAIESTLGHVQDNGRPVERSVCFSHTRRLVDGILEPYCRLKGKSRWCEKAPCNIDYIGYLQAIFPDAKFICLHRHGLDVVASILESGLLPASKAYFDRTGSDLVSVALDRWCESTERLLAFEHASTGRAVRLLYEDLVTDPDHELLRVCQFLELPVIDGLAADAFKVQHDTGAGDSKITGTNAVLADRCGRGLGLDLATASPHLRRRAFRLLAALGY